MNLKWKVIFVSSCLVCFSMAAHATPSAPALTYSINGLKATIAWSNVPNATEYIFSYAPFPYTGPDSIGSINMGAQTSFSVLLWEGAAFFIAVQASNDQGISNYSNIEHFIISSSTTNLTGNWTVIETSGPNNCGDPSGIADSYNVFIEQIGSSLTAHTQFGVFSGGSLVGNTIFWLVSFPEDGGITTITDMNLSVSPDETMVSGSVSWTWNVGFFSCSGTSSVTGSLIN